MAKCFIITPYGKKKDASGKTVNFERIFNALTERVVRDAGLEPIRSDQDLESGPIFHKMIQDIATAEVCIADITTLNPNVFYELGVRHALRRGVTVLIRKKGHPLPFDIQNLRVFAYGDTNSKAFEEARRDIVKAINEARRQKAADSLVFHALPNLSVAIDRPKRIRTVRKLRYPLKSHPDRSIGLIGGDLAEVRGVSVWVNSENTDMQMSRYHEPTVSGTIRYHGAKRNALGMVTDDLIAKDLAACMNRARSPNVAPGAVIKTTAGKLADFGVKFVLHVASVHATPGRGYHSVTDLRSCVKNVLKVVEDQRRAFGRHRASIVFPLLGTGSGGGKIEDVAPELFDAALDHLEDTRSSIIEKIWFLAYQEPQWNACMQALDGLKTRLRSPVREK